MVEYRLLTRNGLERRYDYDSNCLIKPRQCILLTVEEAKRWMRILYENAPYLDCLYECSKDDYFFIEEISKRIDQAEKRNEANWESD